MRREVRQLLDRVRRVLSVSLVVNAALLWLAILLQAAFAGTFLDGTSDALAGHQANAALIGFGALGQLVLATLAALAGHVRWPVVASGVIFLAVGNQISLGYDGDLAVHVPLGVSVFGAQTALVLLLVGRRSQTQALLGTPWARSRRGHVSSRTGERLKTPSPQPPAAV